MVLTKRLVTGKLAQKQVIFDREGDEAMVRPAEAPTPRCPVFTPKDKPSSKKKVRKLKNSKRKSDMKALGKKVEQYDLMNSLAQASSGIKFVQLARGDVDNVRLEIRKLF